MTEARQAAERIHRNMLGLSGPQVFGVDDVATIIDAAIDVALVPLQQENEKLRAALESFMAVYNCLTENGELKHQPIVFGKSLLDEVRAALGQKGESDE